MVDKRLDLSGWLGAELLRAELLGREGSRLLWLRSHRDSLRSSHGSQSLLETEDTRDLGDLLQAGGGGDWGCLRDGREGDGIWEVKPLEQSRH